MHLQFSGYCNFRRTFDCFRFTGAGAEAGTAFQASFNLYVIPTIICISSPQYSVKNIPVLNTKLSRHYKTFHSLRNVHSN